ncbi:hypothetical protein ACMXYX_18085 (plasmid) [Neptuniibacter sp. QD72_48]|uniref:hypothetical protein n=1 Tax=Neptuniibacter sp. QD72_48 TaxID=3398214 RepID=UPI0039F5B756
MIEALTIGTALVILAIPATVIAAACTITVFESKPTPLNVLARIFIIGAVISMIVFTFDASSPLGFMFNLLLDGFVGGLLAQVPYILGLSAAALVIAACIKLYEFKKGEVAQS